MSRRPACETYFLVAVAQRVSRQFTAFSGLSHDLGFVWSTRVKQSIRSADDPPPWAPRDTVRIQGTCCPRDPAVVGVRVVADPDVAGARGSGWEAFPGTKFTLLYLLKAQPHRLVRRRSLMLLSEICHHRHESQVVIPLSGTAVGQEHRFAWYSVGTVDSRVPPPKYSSNLFDFGTVLVVAFPARVLYLLFRSHLFRALNFCQV